MQQGESMNRREFSKSIAAGLGASMLPLLGATRNLKIGYTCITWGAFPRGAEANATLEAAVKDIAALGFYSFETFPEILDDWEARGALKKLIDQYQLPLKSGYCRTNLTDASKRKESVEQVIKLGKTIKKYGGTFGVIAPNSIKRDGYNFKEYRSNIIAGLNDHAQALADLGLGTGLHQHTGTCIETRDEVYDVMESANTKVLKFAPDVGQLQKGGADAAKVVRDFAAITTHMHLKDYSNGKYMAGYCPLGMGVVDLESILKTLEEAGNNPDVMYELDRGNAPMSARDTAEFGKAHLIRLGYKFPMA
jgi:inosose dehydratase